MLKTLLAATALTLSAVAPAASADDLKQLIDEHWRWYLANNPEAASGLGVHDRDGELSDISPAAQDRQARDEAAFLARLERIPDSGLDGAGRVNKGVLATLLRDDVAAAKFGQRQMLFTSYYSWWQGFAGLAEGLQFASQSDYANYLTRLEKFPAYNAQAMAITRSALAQGQVQPCVTLTGIEGSITGVIKPDVTQSRFYEPFTRPKLASVSDADWTALKARATRVIGQVVEPEYRKIATLYTNEYKPKCRATVGAADLPQGREWYQAQVRRHTTTNLTPEQVHQTGLSEVARIRAEMDALAKRSGYPDRKAMIAAMRADPRSYATTGEQLLKEAAYENKLIDGLLPRYFGKLPRLTYSVKPIPAETAEGTTTAYSQWGSVASGIAGVYYVNTSKLDQRPIWELPALTAHEASPGHQLQGSLQQELDLPEFRKHLASFTAYVEGWALYTEHLGIEMGLYDTPAKDMSRLSYEMWRACRLVVDTGLHAKGWSKPQAVAFMRENTALSDANIDAEVNRYISWPGQALGYKMGELKIRELRARAERKLGAKFDLRAFHDAVLALGPVPLDVLEAEVTRWVGERKGG